MCWSDLSHLTNRAAKCYACPVLIGVIATGLSTCLRGCVVVFKVKRFKVKGLNYNSACGLRIMCHRGMSGYLIPSPQADF